MDLSGHILEAAPAKPQICYHCSEPVIAQALSVCAKGNK